MASNSTRSILWALAGAFVVTALAGLVLRWDLVNAVATEAGVEFADLRHAHSHIGFYGFLTLGWWLVLRERAMTPSGQAMRLLSGRWVGVYAGAVLVTSALFVAMGYAVPTIVLSTFIAFFWALEAWRSRRLSGWLSLAPWGVVLGLLLIPAIAVLARRDFLLSRDLAHVFIAAMLLLTFVPVALHLARVPPLQPLVWAVSSLIGATHLVFADRSSWTLGLFSTLAGLTLIASLYRWPERHDGPWWLRASWWLLALGMVVIGLVPPLQNHDVRLAAVHFTVLGPISLTLLANYLPGRAKARAWAFYPAMLALVIMLAAMVAPPGVGHTLKMETAAVAGSVFVACAVLLLWPRRTPQPV